MLRFIWPDSKHAYVITFVQNGEFCWFVLHNQSSVSYAISVFVDVCLNSFACSCYGDKLFDGLRLVARRATYQGV